MSRLLFTCRPLFGHYEPLRPLAAAARDAGHVVAFATGTPADSWAVHDGFEAFPAGPGEDFRQEWGPRFAGWDRLVGDEQRRFFFTEIFANLELVPRAADLDHILDQWKPDLVVHEMAELAAPLVCTTRAIRYVDVSYGPLIPAALLRAAGTTAAPHWRARDLQPNTFAGLFLYIYVDTCPPALQNPEIASVPAIVPMRPAAAQPADAEAPAWLDTLPDLPLVYVTMGTIYNRDLDVFRTVIEGLRDQPVSVVVTVRTTQRPGCLGSPTGHRAVRGSVPPAGHPAAPLPGRGHPRRRRHDARRPGCPACHCCSYRKGPISTPTPTGSLPQARPGSSYATKSPLLRSGSPWPRCSANRATGWPPNGSEPKSPPCHRPRRHSPGSRRPCCDRQPHEDSPDGLP